MTFAEMLREAMGEMRQVDLSDLSGIRQPVICRLLNGAEPKYRTLVRLESVLPRLREIRSREAQQKAVA